MCCHFFVELFLHLIYFLSFIVITSLWNFFFLIYRERLKEELKKKKDTNETRIKKTIEVDDHQKIYVRSSLKLSHPFNDLKRSFNILMNLRDI
jgi:cytoskeletal protein RodZ